MILRPFVMSGSIISVFMLPSLTLSPVPCDHFPGDPVILCVFFVCYAAKSGVLLCFLGTWPQGKLNCMHFLQDDVASSDAVIGCRL